MARVGNLLGINYLGTHTMRKWHAYRYNAEEAQQYANLRKDRIGTKKSIQRKKHGLLLKGF